MKKNFIIIATVVASISLTMFFACSQKNAKSEKVEETKSVAVPSNGVFEIISYCSDSVKFKTVAETKFYAIALVSGNQIFEGKRWSNSEGIVSRTNGAQFKPGSVMSMPANSSAPSIFGTGPLLLPKEIVMTIYGFHLPDSLKLEKIRFITEEGASEMYYNISRASWDK